jgi:protein involved in polysaccharide export with SLBB domain
MNTRWLLPLCGLAVSCATYGTPLPQIANEINATLYTGPTLVEPGDTLALRFPGKAEWNQIAMVRTDGCVSLPVLGEVLVAGRPVLELQRTLAERYQGVLVPPDLVVNLGDPAQPSAPGQGGITVGGEVKTPGLVGMAGERLTLLDALSRAGGHLKGTALLGNTLMLRRSPRSGLYSSWRIDAREIFWDSSLPIYLQRHDMILVPNTPIDNANIWVDQYINKMIPLGVTSFVLGIVIGKA